MNARTFLEQFASQYVWDEAPAKRRFRFRKQINRGMEEGHRLALTLGGVIDRALDDDAGLQSSDYAAYQIFEKNDLVFKLIDLENIKTSRVGFVPRRGIMSPAYIRLQPSSGLTHPKYYYWLFYSAYLNNIFNGMGGGVRQNLTPTDLLEFPIPLPDVDTQKQIAQFLDRESVRIDQLIEKKHQLLEALKRKWAATVSLTLRNGLQSDVARVNSGISWLGDLPAHWRVAKLGHIGRCANGINIPGEAFGSGYPFVSYSDVYRNSELPETVAGLVQSTSSDRARYSLKVGDILFTRTSEIIEEIGFSSVCTYDMPDAVFAGFLIRFRPNSGILLPGFSKFLFRNEALRTFFAKEMMIVTRASLSQNLLQKMPVALPPLEEQETISQYLAARELKHISVAEKTARSIERLREFRTALITSVVTGQMDLATWIKRGETGRRLDELQEAM